MWGNRPQPVELIGVMDESGWNANPYRAVCLVTIERHGFQRIENELLNILSASKSFSWSRLDSDTNRKLIAIKLIDLVVREAEHKAMRVDTLCWDTRKLPQSLRNKADGYVLEEMMLKLIRQVVANRWGPLVKCVIYPDHHNCVNWPRLRQKLRPPGVVSRWVAVIKDPDSKAVRPAIALADFFAGMPIYVATRFMAIKARSGQRLLPGVEDNCQLESRSISGRAAAVFHLLAQARKRKWPLGIESNRRLQTHNGRCPINFWWDDSPGSRGRRKQGGHAALALPLRGLL